MPRFLPLVCLLLLLPVAGRAQETLQKKVAPAVIGVPSDRSVGPQLGGTGLFTTGPAPAPPSTIAPIGTPRSVPPESFPGISNNTNSVGTIGGVPGQRK
jgi:hypothetical protein